MIVSGQVEIDEQRFPLLAFRFQSNRGGWFLVFSAL
jgi:hypothetical protein